MTTPLLAAQTYTIREFMKTAADFATSLQKIRQIGYTAVQLDMAWISPEEPLSPAEIKGMVEQAELTICNTHLVWEEIVTDVEATISHHQLWDCQHVAIPVPPEGMLEQGEVGFRTFAAKANRVGQRLAEAGLTFSYHNHSFELVRFGSQTGLDLIFNETQPHHVLAELDTYWIQHGGGDPVAWIQRMTDRMPVLHLKDMVILPDGSQAFAEVGEGNLNWPAILNAAKAAGVTWYVVEQDFCRRDPFESLKISYENLRQMGL